MLKPTTVRWLQRVLHEGGHSRAALARGLCEPEPPAGQAALEWLLVSSETAEGAERIVGWYETRW